MLPRSYVRSTIAAKIVKEMAGQRRQWPPVFRSRAQGGADLGGYPLELFGSEPGRGGGEPPPAVDVDDLGRGLPRARAAARARNPIMRALSSQTATASAVPQTQPSGALAKGGYKLLFANHAVQRVP
jgi:hypothetical protein